MARSKNLAKEDGRHRRDSSNDRDDDDDFSYGASQHKSGKDDRRDHDRDSRDCDDRHDSHGKHGSCERDHDRRDHRDDHDVRLDLDRRHDGIDLDIDIDRDGRWLDVEIEIGSLDIDLKLDARHLQPDCTPVAAMIGGEATAVAGATLADADIFTRLVDLGSATLAFGTTTFQSGAVSDENMAFAVADTFADVSGADFVFVFNDKVSISAEDASYATETSTTTFVAIDFEDFDFAEGQLIFNFSDARSYLDFVEMCGGSGAPALDGNVATLDVDAQALGENTLVDVLSSVLTIENQLSTVSAVAVTAVG